MSQLQTEEPKSSVDSFTLPCGYLDGDGNLHTEVDVREMTGEEEEILAARNMPTTKKINKILSRCTQSIGEIHHPMIERAIPDLTQGDRIYLLFCIRRTSLGDEMPFTSECPKCNSESQLVIDLSELEVKPMNDPMTRTYETKLPKTGKVVRMKVLTGRGEDAISKASNRGKDVITTAIFCRIDSFDGEPPSMKDLKKLPLIDRNHLREIWEDNEGGIDTEIEIGCPVCDHEYKTELDIGQQGFFNPLAASKSWKKKSSI